MKVLRNEGVADRVPTASRALSVVRPGMKRRQRRMRAGLLSAENLSSEAPRRCDASKATSPAPGHGEERASFAASESPGTYVSPPPGPGRSSLCPVSRTGAARGREVTEA